jgi:hypothetical protein
MQESSGRISSLKETVSKTSNGCKFNLKVGIIYGNRLISEGE